jgi:hypothetical protein
MGADACMHGTTIHMDFMGVCLTVSIKNSFGSLTNICDCENAAQMICMVIPQHLKVKLWHDSKDCVPQKLN